MGLKERKIFCWLTKKNVGPTFSTISTFFGSDMPYPKVDSHQRDFEEDLTLFIVKEQVQLSFVEAYF
jgi:hypothetical protein